MRSKMAGEAVEREVHSGQEVMASRGYETPGLMPVRVRFIGALGRFNSVATQAVRIHNGLAALCDPAVQSHLTLLRRGAFTSRFPLWRHIKTRLSRLTRDADILVVVKPSLFWRFKDRAPSLKAWCKRKGIILVSAPADGVAGNDYGSRDVFTEEIADFVLTISHVQHEYFAARRDPATVFEVGSATRPSLGAAIELRDRVRTVVWENPIHHDPAFNAARNGVSLETYHAFEAAIADFCEARGASLLTFESWRDDCSDEDWERALLAADIAIECKSLEQRYTPYQLGKPAVKLQNYLALGLPVVCDSLPSHIGVGRPASVQFADTLDEWTHSLGLLFENRDLRAQMSLRGREAVAPFSIAAVSAQYVDCFRQMRASIATQTPAIPPQHRAASKTPEAAAQGGVHARLR